MTDDELLHELEGLYNATGEPAIEAAAARIRALIAERDEATDKANRRVNSAYASMRSDNDACRRAEARAEKAEAEVARLIAERDEARTKRDEEDRHIAAMVRRLNAAEDKVERLRGPLREARLFLVDDRPEVVAIEARIDAALTEDTP